MLGCIRGIAHSHRNIIEAPHTPNIARLLMVPDTRSMPHSVAPTMRCNGVVFWEAGGELLLRHIIIAACAVEHRGNLEMLGDGLAIEEPCAVPICISPAVSGDSAGIVLRPDLFQNRYFDIHSLCEPIAEANHFPIGPNSHFIPDSAHKPMLVAPAGCSDSHVVT